MTAARQTGGCSHQQRGDKGRNCRNKPQTFSGSAAMGAALRLTCNFPGG
jgi:hypothetical protein